MTVTTSSVSPFNFGTHAVRVIVKDGAPWFVAKDICDTLGYSNSRDTLAKHLDDDEKGVANSDTLGGNQQMTIINESGLYALVLRSRKPEARKFAKWVTSEVLPAIRKTGQYQQQAANQIPPNVYAPVPDKVLERAADMAGQVFAAAVKSAAFQKGHIDRFLVTSDFVNGKGEMQLIERDAFVLPLRELMYHIRSDSPEISMSETVDIMTACSHRLAVHHSYMQKR